MIYIFTRYQWVSYGDSRKNCLYCIDGKIHVSCYHGFTQNHWQKVGLCDESSCKVHKNLSTEKEEPIGPKHISQFDSEKKGEDYSGLAEFLPTLNL